MGNRDSLLSGRDTKNDQVHGEQKKVVRKDYVTLAMTHFNTSKGLNLTSCWTCFVCPLTDNTSTGLSATFGSNRFLSSTLQVHSNYINYKECSLVLGTASFCSTSKKFQ